MKSDPKEAMVGRWNPGARHAQVLLRIKDVVGSMAEINRVASGLGVDFKHSNAYAVPGKGYAVYSAFVELKDPRLTPDRLVSELMKSPNVIKAHAVEGRESGIVDTLTFPVNWGGRRIVFMNQRGLAMVFHDVQSTFGTGGDVILYKSGTIYGKELEEYLIQTVGRDVLLRNFEYSLELLAASGWGVPELVKADQEAGTGSLRVRRCFECEGVKSSRPICSFIRGALVGSYETALGLSCACTETKCIAAGAEYCEFEFKAGK